MRTCCRSWRAGWTTSCTAPGWRAPAGWPASWSATATSRVNGVHVNVPSYRVSQYDIIDVRDRSLNTVPFQIARETAGDRPIPSWLQVVGERQRILVHQLPERAQIDVPLTEQLIVEYYSK